MAIGDIRLPAAGTGARVPTNSLLETNQKEVARYSAENNRMRIGSYSAAGFQARIVLSAAQPTNASGICLIQNPAGSGRTLVIKRIMIWTYRNASNVRLSAPRMAIERYVHTTELTGNRITPSKLRNTVVDSIVYASDINTGLTVTSTEIMSVFFPICQLTTTITAGQAIMVTNMNFDDEEAPLIAPGEGLRVGRQLDAGDATESARPSNCTVWWDEYTTEF